MKSFLFSIALIAGYANCIAQVNTTKPQQLNYQTKPDASGKSMVKLQSMDSLLQSFVDQKKVANVTGFVAKGGNVVYNKAFGYKDLENKIPATVDDYYILFSQTKAVVTVAFMTLVEKGLVAIDDSVAKYFPDIPNQVVTSVHDDGTFETRPASQPMTFAHLMSHSSGLNAGLVQKLQKIKSKQQQTGGSASDTGMRGQRTVGTTNVKYLEESMIALAKYPLGFDPGTQWHYHVSTNMLGYLIERISGTPLRTYVKATVLDPLGMNDTDWYYDSSALKRFVKIYSAIDGQLVPESDNYNRATINPVRTYAEGAIGLNGPIGDYAKFCQMLLNKGTYNGHQILKPETIEMMTLKNRLPAVNSGGKGFQFGLGFELYNDQKKPVPEVSNTAFAWGGLYGTEYIVDPENDMIALFYLNMPRREKLYPQFLSKAYQLFVQPSADTASVVEDGGTGPYSAIMQTDRTLPSHTLFRPKHMDVFGKKNKLPLIVWGNGACANSPWEHVNFLSEVSSHGFLVVAIGPKPLPGKRTNEKSTSSQLTDAIDWATTQNADKSSPYYNKIDLTKIAVSGMSCGGLQALEVSSDPRVSTVVICNSGIFKTPGNGISNMPNLTKESLKKIHTPTLYILGGKKDIAYDNGMDDYRLINHVPVFVANMDVGHAGTFSKPHGGAFAQLATAWYKWQLKGDTEAAKLFKGNPSGLVQNTEWTFEKKNMP